MPNWIKELILFCVLRAAATTPNSLSTVLAVAAEWDRAMPEAVAAAAAAAMAERTATVMPKSLFDE